MKGQPVQRTVLITLDGVGVGALADAAAYGDAAADTLGHVAEYCGGLDLPNLARLGLGNIVPVAGVAPEAHPVGAYGRMLEASAGKDSTTGHWEIAGLVQQQPFPAYPQGFPAEIIEAVSRAIGVEVIGNVAASGTEIIRELGEEHLRSGRPIVYTSVDSVFQIAAHEEIISIERLYEICRIVRRLLDPYRISRVIARPFVGDAADTFKRTTRRRDFSLPPNGLTLLDKFLEAGLEVYGVGKTSDLFAGRGISSSFKSHSNAEGMEQTLSALSSLKQGLVFTNLVDFDMLYGHRLDATGFGQALEEFDRWLPRLLEALLPTDLLIMTADHGCDPTIPGTDHSRESVPLLCWHPCLAAGTSLGVRQSFTDVAATIAELYGLTMEHGQSFASSLYS
ncbi:phosphopentomutase [Syntrophotalea acetylenivorans]|uniref:phosphopentomutase n=1 Tax=Syntrophotalea acetylenivorans TaxID=1842532 RepID=UPI000AB28578|nr:phosphopentomutase [Syntrophotalea acetylenivorans]